MYLEWRGLYEHYSSLVVQTVVPNHSGVYIILVKLQGGNWRYIYVGQAADLQQRLSSHLSDNESNDCLKNFVNNYVCGFYYAKVGTQQDRDNVEASLYRYCNPNCNINEPSGELIQINLPM